MVNFSRREQLGALLLAGLLIVGLLLRFVFIPKPVNDVVVINPVQTEQEQKEEQEKVILVHVAGAVHRPGVYTLREGARVFEAIEAAGGCLPEGEPHALNLAEPLYDGRRITVPVAGESPGERSSESGKININTATASELEKLPGIGPAKAAAIVSFRDSNGPFLAVDDLAGVPGIGLKTVESLKEYITLY